ncbi:hypothetical protein FC961_17870 [Clostridium botulinum]|nr:hypothetical protein [Clostridium botulinum]NFI96192.1 hypothetical protein [Clostridium botulinum]NFO92970.1 hypothetical protein [Clostridium botulinum]
MFKNLFIKIRKVMCKMNFKFNKESGCTKIWVTLILNGTYEYKDVPRLLNLQECVKEVLVQIGVTIETV